MGYILGDSTERYIVFEFKLEVVMGWNVALSECVIGLKH